MKRIWFLFLIPVLVLSLMLPAAAYAAGLDAGDVGLAGIKGKPSADAAPAWAWGQSASGVLAEPVSGNRYAIVVGISDYPGPNSVIDEPAGLDLFYPDDDAELISMLLAAYGFDVRPVIDQEASGDNILSEIADLGDEVTEDDEVVFYFSGHGTQWRPNQAGIVTWAEENNDTAGIEVLWDRQLEQAFSGFATDRIVFMFDMCSAGGMKDLAGPGRIVCMASTPNGLAYEIGSDYAPLFPPGTPSWLLGINHGLFTYFFAGGLASGNAASVEAAFDFAKMNLVRLSAAFGPSLTQIPVIQDRARGDMVL